MRRFMLTMFVTCVVVGTGAAQYPVVYPVNPPNLSGRWSGEWVSESNGHRGPLHARFRQLDANTYRVAFRGRFAKVVPFWYTTKLHVSGVGNDVVLLRASQRLPFAGEYRTTATATSTHFDATFTSRRDAGRFILNRR